MFLLVSLSTRTNMQVNLLKKMVLNPVLNLQFSADDLRPVPHSLPSGGRHTFINFDGIKRLLGSRSLHSEIYEASCVTYLLIMLQ